MSVLSIDRRLCLLLCLGAALLLAAPVVADEAFSSTWESVSVGIGGKHKVGHWTPVKIAIDASGEAAGRFVLTTTDSEGLTTRFADPENFLLPTGKSRHERLVQFGQADASLTIEFVPEQGPSSLHVLTGDELSPGMVSTGELIVSAGPNIGLRQALPQRTYRNKRTTQLVEISSLEELPEQPLGYDGIDLVVLATSEQDWSVAPPKQLAALRDWLLLGGRAVIACGSQGEALFASDAPLATIAPGEFDRVAPLRRTAAVETYAGSTQRLLPATKTPEVALFKSLQGQVDVSEAGTAGSDQPLIVRYPVGFGQVTLIAFDLDRPPFAGWSGRSKILSRVLAWHQAGETGKGNEGQSLPAQLGYQDLAGQLRMALDQFSGVQLVAFSWVAALIGLYIVIIGPLDYLLVRYGLKRMQVTWLTLGATTIAFVALACWLDAKLKSSDAQINTADIVDVDLATGLARGNSWTHIYAPRTATYDMNVHVTSPRSQGSRTKLAHTALAWEGLPGEGLGGLDGRAPANLFDSPYIVSGESIAGVPLQSTSTKGFVATWWRSGAPATASLEATTDGLVTGKFTYDLDIELTDAAVFYENWLFRIHGSVKPGQVIDIAELGTPRNLLWKLTEKQVIDSKDIITPYDPRTTDIRRILEIMMFHKAAGGDSYTALTQRYQPRIDLSDHLRTGRAILFGRTERSPLAWQGESLASARIDQAITLVRVVIPVAPAPNAP
jgi:hypothetical protein